MNDVLTITFPLFSLVLIGYLFGKTEVLSSTNAKALNDYVYYIALPVLLFYQTAKTPLSELLNYPFILAILLSNLAILAISFWAGKVFFKHSTQVASVYAFSASFPNVGFMGIPLIFAAFGEQATVPTVLTLIIGNIVVLSLVVILLESGGKSVTSRYTIINHSLLSLLKNPVIMGAILGFLVAWQGITMPIAVNNLLQMISQSTAPIALIAIGLSMIGLGVQIKLNELFSLVFLKLLIFPLVTFLLLSYLFEIKKEWAVPAILLSALPTGTLVYIICQQHDLYIKESSAVFLVTTLLSVISIPLLLYIYL
ncbi:MAG: hypothetical protein COB23_02435 [Methylophaga sp.]|nr:MAG: hypothetical protein COB23_02435 [Methylophaga sp.]